MKFSFNVFKYYICLLFSVASFQLCLCERRITHGRVNPNGKRYMVYLLNSPYSENQPKSWLCGGAIISKVHILTAAACLTEVTHTYVIAGYRKYVSAENLENDDCTRMRKQKIVRIILPKAYSKDTWIKYDIGVGVVKEPYDFFDLTYRVICSYEPGSILINYDTRYERPNMTATAYGWGGKKARQPGADTDLNSLFLREAQTVIRNLSLCKTHFSNEVDSHFLCSNGSGDYIDLENINVADFCSQVCDKKKGLNDTSECFVSSDMPARRDINCSVPFQDIQDSNQTYHNYTVKRSTHNPGICENDHGGPLVAWVGSSEVLIGVALNSLYNSQYECIGPFLYISTARCSTLMKCLLAEDEQTRDLCDKVKYGVEEFSVEWPDEEKEEVKLVVPDVENITGNIIRIELQECNPKENQNLDADDGNSKPIVIEGMLLTECKPVTQKPIEILTSSEDCKPQEEKRRELTTAKNLPNTEDCKPREDKTKEPSTEKILPNTDNCKPQELTTEKNQTEKPEEKVEKDKKKKKNCRPRNKEKIIIIEGEPVGAVQPKINYPQENKPQGRNLEECMPEEVKSPEIIIDGAVIDQNKTPRNLNMGIGIRQDFDETPAPQFSLNNVIFRNNIGTDAKNETLPKAQTENPKNSTNAH